MHALTKLAAVLLLTAPAVLWAAAAEGRNGEVKGEGIAELNSATAAGLPEVASAVLRTGVLLRSGKQNGLPGKTLDLPAHPTPGSMRMLGDLPVIGSLTRRVGDRINTKESSHVDAFAVCYHLSDRLGLQVIPGNPGPPRMVASYVANNAGVTVGMTVRLQRGK